MTRRLLSNLTLGLIAFVTNSDSATVGPSSSISALPSFAPSSMPSVSLSDIPSLHHSQNPTISESPSTSPLPSQSPTVELSQAPSTSNLPSQSPTLTSSPTNIPTENPSLSFVPSQSPSLSATPTVIPSTELSGSPSTGPTLTSSPTQSQSNPPSSSTSPTYAPSQQPTLKLSQAPSLQRNLCEDRDYSFLVTLPEGAIKYRDCSWVKMNPERRCRDNVNDLCPKTCQNCKCIDVPGTFTINNLQRDCDWIKENRIRCLYFPKAKIFCPETCSLCTALPTSAPTETQSQAPTEIQSEIPSIIQSIPPSPLPLYATDYSTDVELGFQIFSFPMDDSVKVIFEEITRDFIMSSKKDIDGIDVNITSVKVKSQNRITGVKNGVRNTRRLQKTVDPGLVIVLIVSGEVKTKNESLQDFAFADTVLNGFHNNFTEYSSTLQKNAQIYSSVMGYTNTDNQSTDTENTGNSLTLYIFIGCTVAGCVLVAYLLLMFVKLKHDKQNLAQLPPNLTFQDENEFIKSQRFQSNMSNYEQNIHSLRMAQTFSEKQITNNPGIGSRHESYTSEPIMQGNFQGSYVDSNPHLMSDSLGYDNNRRNYQNDHSVSCFFFIFIILNENIVYTNFVVLSFHVVSFFLMQQNKVCK